MNDFRITIASLPDREHVVAEIFYKGVQWAEISQEEDELVIQLYPHPTETYWEFPLNEAIDIIKKAKAKLLSEES